MTAFSDFAFITDENGRRLTEAELFCADCEKLAEAPPQPQVGEEDFQILQKRDGSLNKAKASFIRTATCPRHTAPSPPWEKTLLEDVDISILEKLIPPPTPPVPSSRSIFDGPAADPQGVSLHALFSILMYYNCPSMDEIRTVYERRKKAGPRIESPRQKYQRLARIPYQPGQRNQFITEAEQQFLRSRQAALIARGLI